MAVNRMDRLKSDGYELYTTIEVGLPHFVWSCDLDIEHDRHLYLSEETLLTLIAAGINKRDTLREVLGISDAILRNGILNLLERHGLEYDQADNLRLSVIGRRMLQDARVRLTSTVENVRIRHDPYREELRWHKPKYDLTDRQLRASGRRRITSVKPINRSQLEERYKEVQKLIETSGLPNEREKPGGKREVLRVHALNFQQFYQPADLEVWYKQATHEFGWRVVRDGQEEPEVARLLDQLEAEGARIIPEDQEPLPLNDVPEENESLHQVAETITQRITPSVLKTHELRQAIKQATIDASKALFIISPWLRIGAIDSEMTRWFGAALERKPALEIHIGYGIERLPDQPRSPEEIRQLRALRLLQDMSKRYGGRIKLVEVGNTHEKIIIVDNNYCVVGSFNFLSFNPNNERGPGVRREIGIRVTQKELVEELLKHVIATLKEAAIKN